MLNVKALEFDVDEDAEMCLSYDPVWLAILKATDSFTDATKRVPFSFYLFFFIFNEFFLELKFYNFLDRICSVLSISAKSRNDEENSYLYVISAFSTRCFGLFEKLFVQKFFV